MSNADKREYPQDLPAELVLLGAPFLERAALERMVAIGLAPSDFYRESHRKIYAAMLLLRADDTPLDYVSLATRLSAMGQLEEVGGFTFLVTLVNNTVHTAGIGAHAKSVMQKAQARRTLEDLSALQECILGGQGTESVHAAALRLAKRAEPVGIGSSLLSARQGLEHLVRYHEQQAAARQRGDQSQIVETPWPGLNRLFGGGWRGGRRPYVIAAQEKVGKTQVAMKALLHAAKNGVHGLLFELELNHIQAWCRLLGLICRISPSRIQSWVGLSPLEEGQVIDAMTRLDGLPLHIDAKVDRKAAGYKAPIARSVDAMKARYEQLVSSGKEPGLIVIDYGQKMELAAGSRVSEERQKYIEISEGVADWATSLSVPVLCLAQCLSRGDDQSAVPTARSIYGTSQFAKDACSVLICDRPPLRLPAKKRAALSPMERDEAAIIVDVEEHGNTGKVEIRHDAVCGDWIPVWGGEFT